MSRIIKPDSVRSRGAAGREADGGLDLEGFLSFEEIWADSAEGKVGADPAAQLQIREEEVRRQCVEMLAQAGQEAEAIREQARQEGFTSGEQEGRAVGRSRYEEKVAHLARLLPVLEKVIEQRNQRYEEEILLLIKTMVERLVQHEVSVNPRVIQSCLRNGLALVAENSSVRVHLHPEDFNLLREVSLEDPTLLGGRTRLELIEDPALSRGGCHLDTDFGEVDASLENSLQKMYGALEPVFRAGFAGENASEGPSSFPEAENGEHQE